MTRLKRLDLLISNSSGIQLAWSTASVPPALEAPETFTVTTLYIRDVSDEVAETLEKRGRRGKSLSAYVAGELSKIASRPTNAQIVARLRQRDRSVGPTSEEIVDAVRAGRR